MITFLDLERNPANRDLTAAGRCQACGETFTAHIPNIVTDSAEPARSNLVLRALERAHQCQTRGAA